MIAAKLLLIPAAIAAEPIARPDKPEPVAGECVEAIGIERGEALPTGLIYESGVAKCSAVALPLSEMQDFLITEEWAHAMSSRYSVDTAPLEGQIDWYRAALMEAQEPVPFWQQPYVPLVVGVIGGAGACIAGAYAVSLIQ